MEAELKLPVMGKSMRANFCLEVCLPSFWVEFKLLKVDIRIEDTRCISGINCVFYYAWPFGPFFTHPISDSTEIWQQEDTAFVNHGSYGAAPRWKLEQYGRDVVILHCFLARQVVEARAHLLQQLDLHPDRLVVAHCCAIFLCCLGGEIFNLVGQLTRLSVHIIPATLFSSPLLDATYLGWALVLKDYNRYANNREPKSPD